MATGFDCDALIEQHRDLISQLVFGFGIRNRDPRALGLQEQRRSHTRAAKPDHQHAFSIQFHEEYFTTESRRHREDNC
jgi:hypothetical protein